MKFLFPLILILASCHNAYAQQSYPTPFGTATLPEGFLPNQGQVRDFNNKPVNFVYFQAHVGGQQVFITRYGLSILLSRPKAAKWVTPNSNGPHTPLQEALADSLLIVDYELERIDIVLKNATIHPDSFTTRAHPQSPQYNLYLGDDAISGEGLLLQSEVLVKNVYPGIDWKVYIKSEDGQPASLKYDFIVHPGADPSRIMLRYSDNAPITSSGAAIKAQAKMGVIREEKPYSYIQEDGLPVAVAFRAEKNTVAFHVAPYDRKHTLVIDPSLFWMTYLSANDKTISYQSISGNDVETDAAGNIFVQLSAGGNTPFPTKNPGGGAYYQNHTASPNGSMILLKFAPGGQLLWSTYFGNWVGGCNMTIDEDGNIVALGMVLPSTSDFPRQNPSFPLLDNGGYYDGTVKKYFMTKFSNSGVLQWSTYYLHEGSYPMDMSYDGAGNIYVVGWSTTWGFPTVDPGGGAYVVNNPKFGYAQTLFIAQFNASNKLTWSTRIEGNDYDPHARVCTDKSGNIYLGGQTRSWNYPLVDAGGYFNESPGGSVITRFNADRKMTWSTYYPAAFQMADLTTDDDNNLFVIAGQRIIKFNHLTELVFEKSVPTSKMHFWKKIQYDPVHDQLQLLGIMNDGYWDFPTINTTCNGSFFHDGQYPRKYNNATGPVFATLNRAGDFTYLSLTDWGYEYYEYGEMTVDVEGNPIYLFGDNRNASVNPNPQLTNPGNGAYFDNQCCYNPGRSAMSALLMKLTTSEISVTTEITPPDGCGCNGVVTVKPQCGAAPFQYEWSNGATTQTVDNLCPGKYWVKVTDAKGLSKTVPIILPGPPGSVRSFEVQATPENCNKSNGTITVASVQDGPMPYSYALNALGFQDLPSFAGLDSGRHIVRVRDANGCIIQDTVLVSRVQGPAAVSFVTTESTCSTDDGQLKINSVQGGLAPFHYSLGDNGSNTTGIFTKLAAATYQLIVSDVAGCAFRTTVTIDKTKPPTDAQVTIGNDHCRQNIGFIQVDKVSGGTAPYTFSGDSLSFANGPVKNLGDGTHILFVKDANGCVWKKPAVIIGQEEGPAELGLQIKDAICGNTTGTLEVMTVRGGSAPYKYALDGNEYTSRTVFSGVPPGRHTITVKDAYGCIYRQDFSVNHTPVATFGLFPVDTTICYNENFSLSLKGDHNQVARVVWNIPAQGFTASGKGAETKKVSVTITDKNNCIIRDTALVRVKACNPPELCLEIPTAFTPNRDGKNETIAPLINGCLVRSLNFRIYNRWGELVFETKKPGMGWNGIYKGQPQPGDVYVFTCIYTGEDGMSRERKGTFVLIR